MPCGERGTDQLRHTAVHTNNSVLLGGIDLAASGGRNHRARWRSLAALLAGPRWSIKSSHLISTPSCRAPARQWDGRNLKPWGRASRRWSLAQPRPSNGCPERPVARTTRSQQCAVAVRPQRRGARCVLFRALGRRKIATPSLGTRAEGPRRLPPSSAYAWRIANFFSILGLPMQAIQPTASRHTVTKWDRTKPNIA